MVNQAKNKGSLFEREVARIYSENGHPKAHRAYGAGRPDDVGDISGVPDCVVECKAAKTFDLSGWLLEAERERANAGVQWSVLVVKRPGKAIKESYAIRTLEEDARLLARLAYLEEIDERRRGVG